MSLSHFLRIIYLGENDMIKRITNTVTIALDKWTRSAKGRYKGSLAKLYASKEGQYCWSAS